MADIKKRVYFCVLSGTFLECFNYTLYAFAISYISTTFFPDKNHELALILSWFVFSITFLVHPFTSIIFGHISDKIGRRKILIISIFLMSITSISIGIIPSYTKIGILSTILLVTCQLIQGISTATSYSGSCTYLLEMTRGKHGLISGLTTSITGMGMVSASIFFLLFPGYWRYGFISSGIILLIVGFFSIFMLIESYEFLQIKNENKIEKIPLLSLFRKHLPNMIFGIITTSYVGILIVSIELYLPTYLKSYFKISHIQAQCITTYIIVIEAVFAVFCGILSDRIKRSLVFIIGSALVVCFCFPVFYLFSLNSIFLWYIAATILALFLATIDGPLAAFIVSLFPTQTRYTGVSLCYNIGTGVVAGITPMLLSIFSFRNHFPVLQTYLVISALVFFLSMIVFIVFFKSNITVSK